MSTKFDKSLIEGIKNILNYSSNGDDRRKAENILNRSKKPCTKLTDKCLLDFIASVDHESIHIPN